MKATREKKARRIIWERYGMMITCHWRVTTNPQSAIHNPQYKKAPGTEAFDERIRLRKTD